MLLEACQWLLTPCPTTARRMGHLAESIAIAARARRCRAAWAPHLQHSRQALLASARRCQRRRVALLLGTGPLLDVPLAELAALFEEVWLVDLVHPLAARWQAKRFPSVRLVEHDVSECLSGLLDTASPALDAPAACQPRRFLDEPRIDWVGSLNLLSQLPNLPQRWLRRHRPGVSETALQDFGDALMRNHLAYLGRFTVPVCLISDLDQTTLAADGAATQWKDLTPFLAGWEVESAWRWDLAQKGELPGGGSAWHRVGALGLTNQNRR